MSDLGAYLKDPSWRAALEGEFAKPYFKEVEAALEHRRKDGAVIFPDEENIFAAFNLTPLDQVKVVILGQDPYHGPGQAMGLSFSVPEGVKVPPSLRNMLKEIESDIGASSLAGGDLTPWARQGVLLLNSVLTVEEASANAHAGLGWERFTDEAMSTLSSAREGVVFLFWGGSAKKKAALIDKTRHTVLTAPHPSPLSAYRGFLGCQHFSKANALLKAAGQKPIAW